MTPRSSTNPATGTTGLTTAAALSGSLGFVSSVFVFFLGLRFFGLRFFFGHIVLVSGACAPK
jgi:hypothetical protein